MTLPAATATTFATIGIREDLSDKIYRISPEETPFTSNIGSSKATATYHEWQTQNLAAATDANAALEGDDATAGAQNLTARVGNRCQISEKTASTSGTVDAVNKAGRGKELDLQVVLKGLELARDIEKQMLSAKPSVAGAAGTARQSGGIEAWLTSNTSRGATGSNGGFVGGVVTAPTPGTPRPFTEALLKTAHLSAFTNGGKPNQLYMSGKQKQVFSGFAGIAQQRHEVGNEGQATIIGAADVYQGDFGRLTAIPHPYGVSVTSAIGVDPRMAAKATLRPMFDKPLGVSGDNNRRQILEEYTLEVRNEAAHFGIFDLS